MKVLTIRSIEPIPEKVQFDVHYIFGMEHHTDYVFKDKQSPVYSATINIDNTRPVISKIIKQSSEFPEYNFIIDDLDLQNNRIERYKIKNGEIIQRQKTGWEWNNK